MLRVRLSVRSAEVAALRWSFCFLRLFESTYSGEDIYLVTQVRRPQMTDVPIEKRVAQTGQGSLAMSGSGAVARFPRPMRFLACRHQSSRSGSPSVSHTSNSSSSSTIPIVWGASPGVIAASPNADSMAMPRTPTQNVQQSTQPVSTGFSLASIWQPLWLQDRDGQATERSPTDGLATISGELEPAAPRIASGESLKVALSRSRQMRAAIFSATVQNCTDSLATVRLYYLGYVYTAVPRLGTGTRTRTETYPAMLNTPRRLRSTSPTS